jgi:hypothetical protein
MTGSPHGTQLKLAWPAKEAHTEAGALAAWNARGTVELIRSRAALDPRGRGALPAGDRRERLRQ